MNDIVPYTDLYAVNLGILLNTLDIPCLSPSMGLFLTGVTAKLNALINDPKLPENGREVLTGYRDRIDDIVRVTLCQQEGVITELESIIKGN